MNRKWIEIGEFGRFKNGNFTVPPVPLDFIEGRELFVFANLFPDSIQFFLDFTIEETLIERRKKSRQKNSRASF